jgi:hypothetical protein
MRDKLNNDPKAQVAMVVVLLVVAAFLLVTRMGGGGEESEGSEATEATVSVVGSGATGTATGATPGEAVEGAVESAAEGVVAEAASAPPAASLASLEAPPLPRPVEAAYKSDKTVVLLIVHDAGIDDKLVERSVGNLEALPDTAVFVVPASKIARYGAITLGVEVSRVPALVVVRPKSLSKGTPQATVAYGYLSTQTMEQAVRDASYHGPPETYHPN